MSIVYLLAIFFSPLSYPSFLIFRISDVALLFCSLSSARAIWHYRLRFRLRYLFLLLYIVLSVLIVNLQSDPALVFTLLYKIFFPFLCCFITFVFLKTEFIHVKNIAFTLFVSWVATLISGFVAISLFAVSPNFRLSFPPHLPLLVDAHIFSGYLIFSALLTEINFNLNLLPQQIRGLRYILYPLSLILVYYTQSRTGLILALCCLFITAVNFLIKALRKLRSNPKVLSIFVVSILLVFFLFLFSDSLLVNLTPSKGFIRLTDLSFSDDSSLYRLSQFNSIGDLSLVQLIFGVPLESGKSIWRDGIITFLTHHLGILASLAYITIIFYFLALVSRHHSSKLNFLRISLFIILILYLFSNLITESAMISRSVIPISVECAMLNYLLIRPDLSFSSND